MPLDRGDLDAQLKEIGEGDQWWERREFRALPYVLHPDERIRCLVTGRLYGHSRPGFRPGRWLVVVTDERILCLRQERFARRQIEFTARQLLGVQERSRLRSFQVTLRTAERRYALRVRKEDAVRLTGALASLMPQPGGQLDAGLDAWRWLPGIERIAHIPGVTGILTRVAMLSPPEDVPPRQLERLEATVERLEGEVSQLQQQVAFLEELMERRAEGAMLVGGAGDG